jgi:hypothetical protein
MHCMHTSEIKYEYCQVYRYTSILCYVYWTLAIVNKCAVFKDEVKSVLRMCLCRLAPSPSCNVHYSGLILYDNERETWSKSS